MRDSLIFWPKISLKLAKWEEKSHTKQLFSQTILPVFPQKIHNFSLVLAWQEIFYQGILEPELSLWEVYIPLCLQDEPTCMRIELV